MNAPDGTDMPEAAPHGAEQQAKRPSPRRTYSKHGLVTLRAAVRQLGPRVVDRRTTLGKQLAAWRAELVRDLGGADAISTQRLAIVDLAVTTKLLLGSIDAWLLTQPSLVNARRKSLLPAVRERQALADALSRYLGQLGLERRAQPVGDLGSYVAARGATPTAEACATSPGGSRAHSSATR